MIFQVLDMKSKYLLPISITSMYKNCRVFLEMVFQNSNFIMLVVQNKAILPFKMSIKLSFSLVSSVTKGIS